MTCKEGWQAGTVHHGFRIHSVEFIDEVRSTAYEMTHEKSGAGVFYLANDDNNKVFSVSFRTTPTDSTGVPHICEHSVLCGSRKFPLKEPFVELVKGSLNTFLNAMTFPDKTMYPVASCNAVDFRNLMDVYLDAVFFRISSKIRKYCSRKAGIMSWPLPTALLRTAVSSTTK